MKKLTISQSLRKEHRGQPIDAEKFENFKNELKNFLSKIRDGQEEGTQLDWLKTFLLKTFYPTNWMAQDKKIDCVVKLGKEEKSDTALLIEAKSTINRSEMVSVDNLNKKAMHELIYYYLHERLLKRNLYIKHLIINNSYEFFIFDAHEFERKFYSDKSLCRKFEDFKDEGLSGKTTETFYKDVASKYVEKVQDNLECTYFDLRDYEKYLKEEGKGEKKLADLYRIFSDTHLMKKKVGNDNNTLNKEFYNELLYILGLEEKKENGKPVIVRLREEERQSASLLENTIAQIEDADREIVATWKGYGETKEEKVFNVALELCITWINRILFLKLLEAQLLTYNKSNEDFKFLSYSKIKDYDTLNKLFFKLLAKDYDQRKAKDVLGFENIPYLNSSLFEETHLEKFTLKVNGLEQLEIPLYKKSVLLKHKQKGQPKEMNTLDYLFSFLDAYSFSNTGDEIRKESKTLINASVLGLIFEKINGHKDGAVFTPGYITMYMCREAVLRSVIQKFNEHFGWSCKTIEDVKNKDYDRKEANSLINSIRICDPSVGSGHFLVSALNEMIRIKFELGVLCDRGGIRIKEDQYNVFIEGDELFVTDEDGRFFSYIPGNPGCQRIQEMLFHEKKAIIENCLFGVDLNPNSAKICHLRLWIELLKNAYYTKESGYKHLETLPNIDVNIKCGNSLVHRFDLGDSIKSVLKNTGISVKEYREAVHKYKNAKNKDDKSELDEKIKSIKNALHTEMGKADKRILLRQEKEMELKVMNSRLFELNKAEKNRISLLEKEIKALNLQIEEIKSNKMYLNAFEWRIEFPELLDDDGNFMGFDCIVGNPPYIQLQKMGDDSKILEKIGYQAYNKSGDICALFYELGVSLLKENGSLLYITTNTWMRTQYGENLRSFLLKNSCPDTLIDFLEYQVFDSVTVRVNMLFLQKKAYNGKSMVCAVDKGDFKLEEMGDYFSRNLSVYTFSPDESWAILSPIAREVKRKVEANGVPLREWGVEINYGIKTGNNDAFIIDGDKRYEILNNCATEEERIRTAEIIRPILRGEDVKRYSCDFADKWLINTHNGLKRKGLSSVNIEDYPALKQHLDKYFEKIEKRSDKGNTPYNLRNCVYMDNFSKPKIVYPNMTKFLPFYFDEKGFYTNQKCFIITGNRLGFLTAFFNSSLFRFCFKENFPGLQGESRELSKVYFDKIRILQIDDETNSLFEKKIRQIQLLKEKGEPTLALEDSVDKAIFLLYKLTEEEIDLISKG